MINNNIYAHSNKEKNQYQPLAEHLHNVSILASNFASHFDAEENAKIVGLYHDIGKMSPEFQKRLEGGKKVDHSSAGAYALYLNNLPIESMCIAGHHGGLLNAGSQYSNNDGTWYSRINKIEQNKEILKNYYEHFEEISYAMPKFASENNFSTCLYTHMLFSSLVDADYLDTEEFMTGRKRKESCTIQLPCNKISNQANQYLNKRSLKAIDKERNIILKKCIENAKSDKKLFTLSVPTGAGKTFSSLTFAAEYIKYHPNVRRIIYVIPYISIIEQTAKFIKNIVGEEFVLEHHSLSNELIEYDEESKCLSAENWDIPIIITTNEQFFESFFGNMPSKCRKLHNVSDSVVIFDEVQMLPIKYLNVCCSLIEELSKNYGVTSVLSSATQPSLKQFFNCELTEIVNKNDYDSEVFQRTNIVMLKEKYSIEKIAEMALDAEQSLIIVNRKDTARLIFEHLDEKDRYILTTNLTPYDRTNILKEIKYKLSEGKCCHVVATSLVEAGVDLDFQLVFREIYGIDSVFQAAGRCNREGNRNINNSFTYVFQLEEEKNYTDEELRKISVLKQVLNLSKNNFQDPNIINYYFTSLYGCEKTDLCLSNINNLEYKLLAKNFKIISDDFVSVIIPNEVIDEKIKSIEDKGFIDMNDNRKLSLHSVKCRRKQYQKLLSNGYIYFLNGDENYPVLNNKDFYKNCGLVIPSNEKEVIW